MASQHGWVASWKDQFLAFRLALLCSSLPGSQAFRSVFWVMRIPQACPLLDFPAFLSGKLWHSLFWCNSWYASWQTQSSPSWDIPEEPTSDLQHPAIRAPLAFPTGRLHVSPPVRLSASPQQTTDDTTTYHLMLTILVPVVPPSLWLWIGLH